MDIDLQPFAQFVRDVGISSALLVGLLVGLYKIIKPLGEKMVALHGAFLDSIIGEHRETKGEVKQIHGKVNKITKHLDIDD